MVLIYKYVAPSPSGQKPKVEDEEKGAAERAFCVLRPKVIPVVKGLPCWSLSLIS